MSHYIVDAKLKYGDLYKYNSIDGQSSVIYRLLTWKEFTSYIELLESDAIARSIVEEQIFSSCVLDEAYVANLDSLLAGDVLTLVNLILVQSGPQTEDDVADKLDEKRSLVYGLNSQIRSIIPMAFPGYSPEDISSMSWDQAAETLALAESVLIKTGVLDGPLQFGSGTKKKKAKFQNINTGQANKSLFEDDRRPPPGDWNLDRMRSK